MRRSSDFFCSIRNDHPIQAPALPHENLLLDSSQNHLHSKCFPPLQQDQLFARAPLQNARKLLSCVDFGRFFLRQLAALLSLWQNGFASYHLREVNVGEGVNLQSRRALLKQFAPQYRAASSAQKSVLLDAFVQATGYHRRYGMWLLNHAEDVLHAPASHYGSDVQHALCLACNAASRICAKRLIPFLPTLIEAASAAWASSPLAGVPKPTAFHERGNGRSPPAFPAQTGPARPLHHTSGNIAEATDPDPYVRGVE
jgi:hypothetical protein